MVSLRPPVCEFDWPAVDFALPDTAGRVWTLADCQGENGMLLLFICNHCPYVKAILPRLIRDCRALQALGVGVAAINSNDAASYPEDSYPAMQRLHRELALPFPYLHDAEQSVARAYGAVCTPDFFGFNRAGGLQYRGRFDASTKLSAPDDARRELFDAMQQVAATQRGPDEQIASIGCSIKWRE